MTDTHWDLKRDPWSNDPRYYPPGQHPATYRWRWTLGKLEEMGQGNCDTAIYLREKLAEFEERESELKARDEFLLRRR